MPHTDRQQDTNPVWYLLQKLWRYSAGNRHNVVLYFAMFVIGNAINFLEPLIIAKLLDTIQAVGVTATSLPTLFGFLLSLLGINVAFWVFHGPARLIEMANAFLVRANYKKYLLTGVMALPIEWHADHHSGDTIDKIEKGTRSLFKFSEDTFQIIEALVRLISSYLVLVYFNLHAAYIVAFMILMTVLMIVRFDKTLVSQYKELNTAENGIAQKIYDVISNITTVVILRIENLVNSAIYQKIMAPFKLYNRNNRINEVKWFLVFMSATLMTVLVLGSYFYVSLANGTVVLVGTVYALYGYLSRITGLFYRFAHMYGGIVQQKAAVMNAEEVAAAFSDSTQRSQHALNPGWQELTIKNLRFSYDARTGKRLHLDNVSLAVRNGQRIALIGASGSGKTTFLKVIRELYRPQQVKVLLDGTALPDGFGSISADIALIPQDPEIFSTTIGENITVGVSHPAAYIRRFTDMAAITELIQRLPRKMNSYIYEKGVNLSGGERQRLALARGLMACEDKSIVLLDEPTSSVDTRNELKIFQNIFASFKEKTIIASVHRLHLLTMFDKIYYFKQGKIVASGTLQELLQTSPDFKETWDKYHQVSKRKTKQ